MAIYDGLLRELGHGDLADQRDWNEVQAMAARISRWSPKSSPMTKALNAVNGVIARTNRLAKAMTPAAPVRDVNFYRREFARMDHEATLLAKSGDLTVEQGSILDQKLDLYFRRHCL